MTADNPGALVLVFQGNDGIHQSMLRSFRACLTLKGKDEEKKQFAQSLASHCSDIPMQMYSERYFVFITHQKLQIYNQT